MFFVSRKLIYPFFLIMFSLVIFGLVFISFLNNSIIVNDPSVSVSGSNLVLKMQIENTSNHAIRGVNVLVRNGIIERGFFLKGSDKNSVLNPGEKFDFVAAIPLEEVLSYSIEVRALFNKTIFLDFELDESTIDPIKAEVYLPKKLVYGREYTYPVKLCNESNNDLDEVYWIPSSSAGDFKEVFYEQIVSIKKGSCETLYSTLTPNKVGNLSLFFLMRIGSIEKRELVVIEVIKNEEDLNQ
ncbi:MAG: hypothetical protein PHD80_03465 [Candidatus ainarchaeum sp.]|nr:hypothetical protein [Candidatus ainarchaeum sp.]